MMNLFIILVGLALLGSGWALSSPILQPVRPGKYFGYVDGKGVLVVPAELDWRTCLVGGEKRERSFPESRFLTCPCGATA